MSIPCVETRSRRMMLTGTRLESAARPSPIFMDLHVQEFSFWIRADDKLWNLQEKGAIFNVLRLDWLTLL